jgi:esterase/lipase superfamily enzyme
MLTSTVYFATNRNRVGSQANGDPKFGIDSMGFTQQSPLYAAVDVVNIDLNDADAGQLGPMREINGGSFSQTLSAELQNMAGNILVFIHGMQNSFEDGIRRAGFLRAWFSSSAVAGSDTTVIAFSWPSDHYVILPPPALPTTAYRRDQLAAADSDVHLVRFLNEIARLFDGRRQGQRLVLLSHSMGNFVLGGAVEKIGLLNPPRSTPLFDQAILAAADEIYTTFMIANDIRLCHLDRLATRTGVYWNRHDVAMLLSRTVNNVQRLGDAGPFQRVDPASFSRTKFDLADCSNVTDYSWVLPVDSSHQYYRRSKTVRNDIACLIAGIAPAPGTRTYLQSPPGCAVYTL